MHAKYQCSIINTSNVIYHVEVFVTDRQRDGRMNFNVPRFRKSRGTITCMYGAEICHNRHAMAINIMFKRPFVC